jgi:glycyl-tRNA synthetase beta chain
MAPDADGLAEQAYSNYGEQLRPADESWKTALFEFLKERESHLFERRGFRADEVRAVLAFWRRPYSALRRVEALSQYRHSKEFEALATLFKRVKNITKGVAAPSQDALRGMATALTDPAEQALLSEVEARAPAIRTASDRGEYRDAFAAIAALQPSAAKFFDDVLVMADDEGLRNARLALVATLRDLVLDIADISEIVTET